MDRLSPRKPAGLPLTPATSTAQPTLNPKSATYLDDLYKAEFISKAQLDAAKSAKAGDIEKANNEAFKKAIRESKKDTPVLRQKRSDSFQADISALVEHENPLTQAQSEVVGPAFNVRHRTRDAELIKKHEGIGYRFVKSSNKGHNCLIISILQHLTGDYEEKDIPKHEKDAQQYREAINLSRTANAEVNFQKNEMLLADHSKFLLQEMKKEERFKNKNLSIEIWTAADKGKKVSYEVETGNKNGQEKVIIFQKVDHFVPVLPPGHRSNPGSAGSTNSSSATMTAQASASVSRTGSGTVTSASIPLATPGTTNPVPLAKND